jgi:ribosomal protein S6--L-glutamate ligase
MIEEDHPAIYYKNKLLAAPDAVIPRIGASRTFYGSAVVRQFEMMHVFTSVKSQAILRSRDKLRSLQILSRRGIGLPVTAFSSHPEQIKSLIQKLGGPPIIIKLLEGTQGKGVVLAETINAAKSALDAFYGLKANILVQEYIKEASGRDIRVFVVNGKVAAAMIRQGAQGEFRSNLHQGGQAKLVKLSKEERALAINAAKALGLSIAGVDILPSERGPLIMEVNSSPGLEGIETTTGKNIAAQIIRFVEQNARKKVKDKVGL